MGSITEKRVLVLGGTGFIGGRLVEVLTLECNARVRALVRDFSRAPRLARFAVEMVHGDIMNADAVSRAVEGCDVVFNCAYGKGDAQVQRRVNVDGTRNVLEAALKWKAERVVHVSTVAVYGQTADGDLDETARRKYSGEIYADTKLDGEKVAFAYYTRRGVPVTVLQPTIVYGPWAPSFTIRPIQELKTGQVVLVDGGEGFCNAVYVDDVVQALVLAAENPAAVGEAFLISYERPVSWKKFYGSYETMLGVRATAALDERALREMWRQHRKDTSTFGQVARVLRERPQVRQRLLQLPLIARPYRLAKAVLPGVVSALEDRIIGPGGRSSTHGADPTRKPIHFLSEQDAVFFSAKTHVRIDKAKRVLGFSPQYDLSHGMSLTHQWADWANLL